MGRSVMYSLVKKIRLIVPIILGFGICVTTQVYAVEPGYYGLGRIATDEEIAGWNIDVRPDGQGLPPGSGSVEDGESLYEEKCSVCHGLFGEGEGRWPKLAGGFDTLTEDRPEKTVGSYWPYASTLWDYIHRAMPFTQPQSLSDDETYAITAYVLYLNEIVEEEFVLTQETFKEIEMPNKDGFFIDPRPDVINSDCMENCKDPDSIKVTSAIKGITPLQHLENKSGSDKGEEALIEESSDQEESSKSEHGAAIYKQSCAVCHGQGVAGAPKTGEKSEWETRIAKGIEVLVDHAINGYTGDSGVMPAKGGNAGLSDDEVRHSVEHMIEQSR
ncbi:MAG: c-type cytochrome [Gammaproteobacteria bacterium]